MRAEVANQEWELLAESQQQLLRDIMPIFPQVRLQEIEPKFRSRVMNCDATAL